ncbi:hypothetical protein NtRootA1_07860 [Arthrobacter sp. NtRootA1]|nr:hypothetical protein NtRootA1_07860 [Arthrobacter sp. NtRootA1]
MDGSTVLVLGFAVGVGRKGNEQALSTSREARAKQRAANPRRLALLPAAGWTDRSLIGVPAGRRGADFMDSPIAG